MHPDSPNNQPSNPPIPTGGVIAEGVPTKVSESWPHEVWRIGDHTFVVEAGTSEHFAFITARKAEQAVVVAVEFRFPTLRTAPRTRKTTAQVEGGEA